MSEKTFYKASVLLGKADVVPSIVEAVQFHGIHITKSDALLKEVSELYKSSNVDELLHNSHLAAKHLQEVGLMENAVALIDTAPSSNGYIVNFVVKEPKAFSLGVKAGMSTNGDADVSLNAGKMSLQGRGEAINSSYTYTVKGDHSFNVSFTKPFLGWQKYSNVSASLYRSMSYLPWNQSNCDENALILQYNGQLSRKILHSIKLNSIWRSLKATDDAAFAVREHAGHTIKFSMENCIAFDSRDRPILATKGLLSRICQEYAGPLGDSSFLRHQVDFQAAAPLLMGFVLSASLQLKNVKALGDREIHLLDRLYLGGQQDVRGFGLNTLGASN
uniref:Bac_surface_Ag domain-containing protein n=1 Tax=Heterorhabditis bacteriophora TaxID=37862 RepID=A0A1I7X438_HETBA